MKILNELIKFGKAFSGLTQIAQLAVVIALITVAFSMGSCGQKDKLDQFIVQYKAYQKTVEKTLDHADSLKKQITILTDSVTKQDVKIQELTISISFKQKLNIENKVKVNTLETRIAEAKKDSNHTVIIATQDTAISVLKTQLNNTESIVVDQQHIINAKTEQVNLLQNALTVSMTRADSLQSVLSSLPKPPTNPNKLFGIIPMPSRTVVGIVAFAGGVVLGSKIPR